MNFVCTWLCADEKGEESIFPQTGQSSSSQSHQNIYWRCLVLFYITSRRYNKHERHILFTNVRSLPVVDGRSIEDILDDLKVEVVFTDFRFKTPKGYFGMFQNQFYEFSILEHISKYHEGSEEDQYLIVDSDCIFIKAAAPLFELAKINNGFISFEDDVNPDYVINGLSRNHMKSIYEDLLQTRIQDIPGYHLGEFLLCSVKNIRKIFSDFEELWPVLLQRNLQGKIKFNEEAHTLSYLYYKNGLKASQEKTLMKRIWTNPLFYRNVAPEDVQLILWHLPAEKTFGLSRLYDIFMNRSENYGYAFSDDQYLDLVQRMLGIPSLPIKMKIGYYTLSYYRAIMKRIKKWKVKTRPKLAITQ